LKALFLFGKDSNFMDCYVSYFKWKFKWWYFYSLEKFSDYFREGIFSSELFEPTEPKIKSLIFNAMNRKNWFESGSERFWWF